MPRFHFPIVDGTKLDDPFGIDLPNTEQARRHAENIARHLAGLNKERIVIAINEDGDEVHKVRVEADK
jgi:hypothetical protein